MQPTIPDFNFIAPRRLAALMLAIVAIVVAPFLVLRVATERSLEAAYLVSQALAVEKSVHALSYEVRSIEAAALALAAGIDTPQVRKRIAESTAALDPALAAIARLTRDNPEQQVRVGALQARLEARAELSDRIIAHNAEVQRDAGLALVSQIPVRDLSADIIAAERARLSQRMDESRRLGVQASMLTWGAMFAQLLLLGLMMYFSRRQVARRIEAERESQRASARAQAVLQTVREPIVLVDDAMNVVMHNTAFSEQYAVKDDINGTALSAIGGDAWSDPGTLQRLSDVLVHGRELWDFEQSQRSAGGSDRIVLINARRMPLPGREDCVVLVTASDITAQKVTEQRVNELNRQLEGKIELVSEVNRELEAFSYSVSHDLRAPLRHIAGFADKLGRHLGEGVDDKSVHYLDVIGSSAQRMSSLIDDLLVYSRLGRSALRLQTVDMQTLVAETRAMIDSNAMSDTPDRRIEWRVGPLPVLVADDNMMRQVWQNLLDNAVKYSARTEHSVITIAHHYGSDGSHRFSVGDNGAGFDMAYAGKLFGVFQRLHKVSEYAGTGIGLASVRRVLARHRGQIWAEAEAGVGATFHFSLPASTDQPVEALA
ncbi:MAG: ATP-binding protein [Pseudomonadota bacterium]|nr:ATP-binding protein [Pseudomonadota bacterium]